MLKNAHTAGFLKCVRRFFNIMHGKVKKVTGNCKLSGHIILKILSNFQLLLFKIPEVTKKITIGKFFERDYESRNYQNSQAISALYKKFSFVTVFVSFTVHKVYANIQKKKIKNK